jgi:hypothetical protein
MSEALASNEPDVHAMSVATARAACERLSGTQNSLNNCDVLASRASVRNIAWERESESWELCLFVLQAQVGNHPARAAAISHSRVGCLFVSRRCFVEIVSTSTPSDDSLRSFPTSSSLIARTAIFRLIYLASE